MNQQFFWGAATSSHQVEGGLRNDWTVWEHENAERLTRESKDKFGWLESWEEIKAEAQDPKNYISGKSVDHYNRIKEDIELMAQLGLTAYRFSIEWSRIEPEEGKWNVEAIEHYQMVCRMLREKNIEPFVTLWHRTNPVWTTTFGDWTNGKMVHHYLRYVAVISKALGNHVQYWMPLNEPVMSIAGGYIGGVYPPAKKNLLTAWKVFRNMAKAHRAAYSLLHKQQPNAVVGIPHAAAYVEAYKQTWLNKTVVNLAMYVANWLFTDRIKHHIDFFGVQYYARTVLALPWHAKKHNGAKFAFLVSMPGGGLKTDMGWEVYPPGIYAFVELAWKRYQKPIIITENGVADRKDAYRAQVLTEHVDQILKAKAEGVDVRGYFHWSFLDNMEWDKGFWPKFGLIAVDRTTMQRTIKQSARTYAAIIKKHTQQS